jgi:hypothetical protein
MKFTVEFTNSNGSLCQISACMPDGIPCHPATCLGCSLVHQEVLGLIAFLSDKYFYVTTQMD